MYKSLAILLVVLFMATNITGLNAKLFSMDTSYISMRGDMNRGDMNRDDMNRGDMNRNDLNRNDLNRDNFDRGAATGAAYGAAAGNANANSGAIPVNPNAAEQNMLYYSGVQNMEQGQ